jgi:hypothetical protein
MAGRAADRVSLLWSDFRFGCRITTSGNLYSFRIDGQEKGFTMANP